MSRERFVEGRSERTTLRNLVDVTGFEPATPCLQIQKANSGVVKSSEKE